MKALATTLDPAAPLAIRDVPDPFLTAHRALVQVKAFSLNRGELASIARNGVGWIPGQDIAGTVVQAAADGSGPPVGSRVVALTDELGWAELAAVEGHRMAVLPDNVDFEQACTLPVAGLTALRCVRLGGAIVGRRVLVTGAAGGVGTLAVQIAAQSGAHVTAVVGHAGRAAGLHKMGASEIVEGIENAQGRYWLILESGGGASLSAAVKLVEPRGIVAVYGNSAAAETALSFGDFRGAQNARIQSFFYFTSEPEEQFAPDLALLVSMVANATLRPAIGSVTDWADFAAVAEALRARRIAGKAVFRVGS
ncbi:MAG: zinc-binding dehydrogenase [Rhodospirillales bacterium]